MHPLSRTLAAVGIAAAIVLIAIPSQPSMALANPFKKVKQSVERAQKAVNNSQQKVDAVKSRVDEKVNTVKAFVDETGALVDSTQAMIGPGGEEEDMGSGTTPPAPSAPSAGQRPNGATPKHRAPGAPKPTRPEASQPVQNVDDEPTGVSAAPQARRSDSTSRTVSRRSRVVAANLEANQNQIVTLVAVVKDASGRPLSNCTVIFRMTDANGAHDVGLTYTNAQGRAERPYRVNAAFIGDDPSRMISYVARTSIEGRRWTGRGRILVHRNGSL